MYIHNIYQRGSKTLVLLAAAVAIDLVHATTSYRKIHSADCAECVRRSFGAQLHAIHLEPLALVFTVNMLAFFHGGEEDLFDILTT